MQENPLTDQELVRRFLARWEGVSGPRIERSVPGVTQSDVSRWRTGKWKRLTAPKARALREALQAPEEAPDDFVRGLRTALEQIEPGVEAIRGLLRSGEGPQKPLETQTPEEAHGRPPVPDLDLPRLCGELRDFGALLEGDGRLEAATRAFKLAYAVALKTNDLAEAMEAARLAARVLRKRADWDAALSWYGAAEELARRTGDTGFLAQVFSGLSNIHRERGNLSAAREVALEQLEAGRSAGQETAVAQAHHQLLVLDGLAEEFTEALKHGWRALRHCQVLDDRMRVLADIGDVAMRRGDLDVAEVALQIVVRDAPTLDTALGSMGNLAVVAALRGDEESWRRRTDRFEGVGIEIPPHVWAEHLYWKGISLRALGRMKEAREVMEEAVSFSESHGFGKVIFDVEKALKIPVDSDGGGAREDPDPGEHDESWLRELRTTLESIQGAKQA